MIEPDIIKLQRRPPTFAGTGVRLVSAGIVEGSCVYTGPRHHGILRDMQADGMDPGSRLEWQGFVDTQGYWYNREDSKVIAIAAGQVDDFIGELYSEALWDEIGREYRPNAYALWLDDERPVPHNFSRHNGQELRLAYCATAKGAIDVLKSQRVVKISLDHDLGDGCGTGYDVAKFIEEQAHLGGLGPIDWAIHSMNPVGVKTMLAALNKADEYWYAE